MTITPKTNFFPRFLPKLAQPRNLPLKTSLVMYFLKILKIDLTWRGQSSKFDLILPRNHVLACCSDPAGPIWTKIGTVKQLDTKNKLVMYFFENSQNWPHTERSNVKIWPNFCPEISFLLVACRSVPASPKYTKIGTIMRLDPTNKLVNAFLKFSTMDSYQ